MLSQGAEYVGNKGRVGDVCGGGSEDEAEVEVRFNVGDNSVSEEPVEFCLHDIDDYVYVFDAISIGGSHVRWGCLVSVGSAIVVVPGNVAGWWGEYVQWKELG